jgi:hypothetical protein
MLFSDSTNTIIRNISTTIVGIDSMTFFSNTGLFMARFEIQIYQLNNDDTVTLKSKTNSPKNMKMVPVDETQYILFSYGVQMVSHYKIEFTPQLFPLIKYYNKYISDSKYEDTNSVMVVIYEYL